MRGILTALAIGVFALAVPPATTPAQAASENGARIDGTQCYPSSMGSGYTACFTTKGASNETTTPSGNVNEQFNGTVTFTIKDPAGQVVYQSTHERHYQRLVQNGVVRTEGEHFSETFPLNGKTCTFQSNFQYANGEVRYSNFQSGCY